MSPTRVTRREIKNVLLIAALVLVLTGLPYVYGYLSTPAGQQFMGIAWGTPDTNEYFAWMRAFTQSFLINNTLTPEPNAAIFFNLLWWLLAQIVALGVNPLVVFHGLRILATLLFLVTVYYFGALFFEEVRWRMAAFVVVTLGAGLGWALVVGKYLTGRLAHPLDLYVVEPNTLLSILSFPHFLQAAWLILVVFMLILLAYERQRWGYALAAGLVALLLGWTHAYDLLLIYAVLGVFTFLVWLRDGWSGRLLLYPLTIGLISCAPAFYSVYITSAFPVWREVFAQFGNAGAWTPDPFRLLVVMGIPFIVALLTFDGLVPLRERSLRALFLRVWFGVNLFIIYFPVSYQIHYLNGWQIAIALLATEGLARRIIPWLGERLPRLAPWTLHKWVVGLLLVAIVPTNVYLLAWRVVDLSRHQHPYYLYQDEIAALQWLENNTTPDDVVLSAIEVGQYIPSRAGNRAFLAHWAMTADVYHKQELVTAFFNPATPDEERQDILRDYGVTYVFYGSVERGLGDPALAARPYLEAVFASPQATLYKVVW